MNEKKDYQRPYFQRYMELVGEIEKLPASEQETKVVTMFHEFYKDMRDTCELTAELSIKYVAKSAELQSTITQQANDLSIVRLENKDLHELVDKQTETIRLLKEDAERLAEYPYIDKHVEGECLGKICKYCECWENENHDTDCPITLHNQLINSLEGKE